MASLYDTYMIDSVAFKYVPSQSTVALTKSPVTSFTDVAALDNVYPDTLDNYFFAQSVNVSPPTSVTSRSVAFKRILEQVVSNPYLQTNLVPGTRETYQMDGTPRVPGMFTWQQFNCLNDQLYTSLCEVHIKTKMFFRGRVLQPSLMRAMRPLSSLTQEQSSKNDRESDKCGF